MLVFLSADTMLLTLDLDPPFVTTIYHYQVNNNQLTCIDPAIKYLTNLEIL